MHNWLQIMFCNVFTMLETSMMEFDILSTKTKQNETRTTTITTLYFYLKWIIQALLLFLWNFEIMRYLSRNLILEIIGLVMKIGTNSIIKIRKLYRFEYYENAYDTSFANSQFGFRTKYDVNFKNKINLKHIFIRVVDLFSVRGIFGHK